MRDPGSLAPRELELVAELLGALDSHLRLRILLLLHDGDHVVHELVTKLGKSQPLISQHLRDSSPSGSWTRAAPVSYTHLTLPTICSG